MSPKPLNSGDTIGVMSPSSPFMPGAIDGGIRYLQEKGFKLKFGKHMNDAQRFLAGKDVERVSDFMNFIRDPEVKAIVATRGGQGSQRLLPFLDYDVIRANPKILMGFSDTTALQNGLFAKTGLISYSGYVLTIAPNPLIEHSLMSCLKGEPYHIHEGKAVHSGVVEGILVGGNVSLLCALIGTPYQPNFEGKILLLEDVGVEPYNLDRLLSHLDLAGVFDQVAGIVMGEFDRCVSRLPYEGTVDDVINEWSSRFKVPCLKDFPYGHGERRCVLPIGKKIKLDVHASAVYVSG